MYQESYKPQFDVLAPPKKPFLTRKRAAAVCAASLVFGQNVDQLTELYSFMFVEGHMAPKVAGCEYTPPPETTHHITTTTVTESSTTTTLPSPTTTNPVANAQLLAEQELSSADNNSYLQMVKNLPVFLLQNHNKYDHFEHAFFSKHSGIRYEIYNTGEDIDRRIDYNALDDVLHLAFTTDIDHVDARIEDVTECVSTKLLEEKVLAGKSVKMIIPSTSDYCISNLLLARVSDRRNNICTQSGGATPKIEVEAFIFKPFSEQFFYVTAGNIRANTVDELNEKLAEYVTHENAHRIYYEFGVLPRKHPDERMVEYHDLTIKLAQTLAHPYGPPAPTANGFARSKNVVMSQPPIPIVYENLGD